MTENLKDIFKPKSDKDIKAANDMLDLTAQIARKCLEHADFKTYKDSYERTEKATVDSIISYSKSFIETPGGDVSKFAMTIIRLATKLESLRYLVKTIENSAKRADKDGK